MAGLQLQGQLEARLGGAESGASDVAASSAETIDDGPEPGEGNFDNIQPGETRTYAWGTAHRTEDGTLELYADAETKSTERLRDLLGEIDAVGPDAIAKAIHRMRRRPDLTSVEAGLVRGFGALTVPFAAAFDATELAVSPIMISIAGAQFLIERGKEIRAMSPEERASWKAARRPKRATRKLEQAEDRVHVLKFGIDEAEEKGDVKGAQRLARKAEKAQARLDRLPRDLDG